MGLLKNRLNDFGIQYSRDIPLQSIGRHNVLRDVRRIIEDMTNRGGPPSIVFIILFAKGIIHKSIIIVNGLKCL